MEWNIGSIVHFALDGENLSAVEQVVGMMIRAYVKIHTKRLCCFFLFFFFFGVSVGDKYIINDVCPMEFFSLQIK